MNYDEIKKEEMKLIELLEIEENLNLKNFYKEIYECINYTGIKVSIIGMHKKALFFDYNDNVYSINNNGGEFNLRRGNEMPISIPYIYFNFRATPATMAYRLSIALRTYSTYDIDWNFKLQDYKSEIKHLFDFTINECTEHDKDITFNIDDIYQYYFNLDNMIEYIETNKSYTDKINYTHWIKDYIFYHAIPYED